MVSTDSLASTAEACKVEKDRVVAARVVHEELLGDICRKIEGVSYYSGSSSTWFLRGALAKREEKSSNGSGTNNDVFSPQGLTDVLLEKLLFREKSDNNLTQEREDTNNGIGTEECDIRHNETDPDYGNYLTVAKALAGDSFKYLPAIAASLSRLVSSAPIAPKLRSSTATAESETPSSSIIATASRGIIETGRTLAIPREFLELWVSTIVDQETPEGLHDRLSEDLFRVFRHPHHRLRDSCDPRALPKHALVCLVQGDTWHHHSEDNDAKSKSLSPPNTKATLRRASILMRFLSRGVLGCQADPDTDAIRLEIATASGAITWFLQVLWGRPCPVRHEPQRRETRTGLLDLLLDEFQRATHPVGDKSTVEWLMSSQLAGPILVFYREALRELVEDWNGHLASFQPIITTPAATGTPITRTNRDLLSNRKALDFATRFVKFLARLPPSFRLSSLVIAEEASRGFDYSGKELLAIMLCAPMEDEKGSLALQRLRLVRLLIDEFGSAASLEKDEVLAAVRKAWLSSPEIMGPVLEECSTDPFLGSSDTTDRYLEAYGDPSRKNNFFQKPLPRQAPAAIALPSTSPDETRAALAAAEAALAAASKSSSSLHVPRWFAQAVGKLPSVTIPVSGGKGGSDNVLSVLRNKLGDRLSLHHTKNGDHYSLFDGGERAAKVFELPRQPPQDRYSLFDGGTGDGR